MLHSVVKAIDVFVRPIFFRQESRGMIAVQAVDPTHSTDNARNNSQRLRTFDREDGLSAIGTQLIHDNRSIN